VDASAYMTKWAIWVDAIRLYDEKSDMDGQLSVYMPNWTIWVDSYPSIYRKERYRWMLSVYI